MPVCKMIISWLLVIEPVGALNRRSFFFKKFNFQGLKYNEHLTNPNSNDYQTIQD